MLQEFWGAVADTNRGREYVLRRTVMHGRLYSMIFDQGAASAQAL